MCCCADRCLLPPTNTCPTPPSPQLTPPKDIPEILKFLKQVANPLMLLLLVAGGLTYMVRGGGEEGRKKAAGLTYLVGVVEGVLLLLLVVGGLTYMVSL